MIHRISAFLAESASSDGKIATLYQGLFEKSHSVMLIIHPENGSIIDANMAACDFYQYSHDVIVGMSILDINIYNPDRIHEEMQKARLEKRNYFNFRHRLANGEIRDVEVYSSPVKAGEDVVLYSVIHDISERKKNEIEREDLIGKLENALAEIRTLKGILPICSSCKKIRDDEGYWKQIEIYICEHSDAEFTHGICPECARKLYPEFYNEKDMESDP